MTIPSMLSLRLLSDATFARGTARAGEVDVETDHDPYGLPRIGGKRIRSLLRDTWLSMAPCFTELNDAALRVFGPPGDVGEQSILRIGSAELESGVRELMQQAVERERNPIDPLEILHTLTAVRAQTSEARATGAPERASLRSVRVSHHSLMFYAPLQWLKAPGVDDLRCLALSALGMRHAGLGRNRGRGHLETLLDGKRQTTLQLARGEAS